MEQFGFRRASAASSSAVSSATSIASDQPDSEGPTAKKRRFNNDWAEGRVWLQHDKDNDVMFCEWCRRFDKNEHRNQFVKGCTSMKLESVKKHKQSRQHRDSEAAQRASNRPERAPMELTIQTMEHSEVEQMKRLVVAERPFRDFPALLQLQGLNGLQVGRAYNSPNQARRFVHFIAEEIRKDLVETLQKADFFSVCMDSSTDKATIDEEMVQVVFCRTTFQCTGLWLSKLSQNLMLLAPLCT